MIISIFTTRYLLANLGVEDYGVYNVTLGIVSMCAFLGPSLSNSIQRYYSFELGKNGVEGAKRVFNTALRIQVIMSIAFFIICETIGLWYILNYLVIPEGRESTVFWIYQIGTLSVIISLIKAPLVASILSHERMNYYAMVTILDTVIKLLIAILIKYSNHDRLLIYAFLLLLSNLFDIGLYYFYSKFKFEEIKLTRFFDKSLFKKMLSFSGWNLFESMARLFKDQVCNLMLNFFYGPVLNAARGVANQVMYAYSSMVESTIMASRPQMVQQYASGHVSTSINMFYTLTKCTLFLIFIFALPVFLEVDYILRLWLGHNIPDYTAILVRLSLILVLVDKMASPVTALVHSTGNIKWYHVISGIINILLIPIAWVLLKFGYGVDSVYVATIVLAVLAQICFIFILNKLVPFSCSYYFKEVCLKFFLVSVCCSILPSVLFWCISDGVLRMLLILASSVLLSSIIFIKFGLNCQERTIIVSLFQKYLKHDEQKS